MSRGMFSTSVVRAATSRYMSARQATAQIQSGNRVFIATAAAAPQGLIDAMVDHSDRLRNVEVVHLHTEGEARYVEDQYRGIFHHSGLFLGHNTRKAARTDRASYIPIFLSETPNLFRRNILPLDVAMVTVSPPDKFGWCSLGTSVDCTLAAVQTARHVIAEVNPTMPRTHGDSFVHVSRFSAIVETDKPIHSKAPPPPSEAEIEIGKHIAGLIPDGATLQMGIGSIPNAVLAQLKGHRRLGIHTEMFSDGVIDLVESGTINGTEKHLDRGKITACFLLGTPRLYDFVNDNPTIRMMEASYTNDASLIRMQPKMCAINSAIEVDLTGQICADSIGTAMYSGVGGQMDFMRGAALSEGGRAIIAMPARTAKGQSKIVPFLKQGAGVVTTRAHAHYVVTEFGYTNLYGKNLWERAESLVALAHPDDRHDLMETALRVWHHDSSKPLAPNAKLTATIDNNKVKEHIRAAEQKVSEKRIDPNTTTAPAAAV